MSNLKNMKNNEQLDKIFSIVVPCFNEASVLQQFYSEVNSITNKIALKTEFVFVDDGSSDKTMEIIKILAENDDRIHYVSFSRNFGKEAALLAGLEHSTGDYVVVMDADLQDPPSMLIEMLNAVLNEDYDCAATRRVTREGEPAIRSFLARMFYKLINKISDTEVVDGVRDFRVMSRRMVDAILSLKEKNRFSKGIFSWVGFRTKWFEYKNIERVAGETKWSFRKLLLYSIDGIIAFSSVPLSIASFVGFLLFVISVVLIFYIIFRTIVWGDPVAGWPSTVCIILFIGGIQLFAIGILGQYISKIYIEIKNRPLYIIKEKHLSETGLKRLKD